MPFLKGNTYGNRKGRPKKAASLTEHLRAELERAYNGQAMSNKERIAAVMVKQACGGNLRAAAWLLDRTEGTAPQRFEHTGKDGRAIQQTTEHTGIVEVRAVDYRHSIRALAPPDDLEAAG